MNDVRKGDFYRNNQAQMCPFMGRMLVPTAIAGQLGITEKICGEWCPLFEIGTDETKISIFCGSEELVYDIEKVTHLQESNLHSLDLRKGKSS